MSGKKFKFKDLAKWSKTQRDLLVQHYDNQDVMSVGLLVDWCEFNKMFFSRRNVIVLYPPGMYTNALMLAGLYSSLKVAKSGTHIGMCNFGSRIGFPFVIEFAKKIVNKPGMDGLVIYNREPTPFQAYRNRVLECDEWILDAGWGPAKEHDKCSGETILKWIDSTNGLSEFDVNMDLYNSNRVLFGWEGLEKSPRRKFVVAWEDGEAGRNALAQVMEKYPDKFLVVEYAKEKRMVDEWYSKNETIVDPEFDIQLMDRSLDQRRVLLYAASNHLYDFRKFAKTIPEAVEPYISKQELKELL